MDLTRYGELILIPEVVLLIPSARSLALASGLTVPGEVPPATPKEPELIAEMLSLVARRYPPIIPYVPSLLSQKTQTELPRLRLVVHQSGPLY